MRDSMIFYRSFFEALTELEPTDKAVLYDAIFSYGLDFKEPKLSGIQATIWKLIKPNIDANIKKYKDGNKGGRPPKNKTTTKPQNNHTVTTTKPNVDDDVDDDENDNENDNKRGSDFFSEESLTPSTLHEDTLENAFLNCPQNPKNEKYTPRQIQVIIEWKKVALELWIEAKSLGEDNERQKIEFVKFLNKRMYEFDYNGLFRYIGKFNSYIKVQRRTKFQYVCSLDNLDEKIKEKDWIRYFKETADIDELDPEPPNAGAEPEDKSTPEWAAWKKKFELKRAWKEREWKRNH